MTVYILIVALLNLALGYGLAITMSHVLGGGFYLPWRRPAADDDSADANRESPGPRTRVASQPSASEEIASDARREQASPSDETAAPDCLHNLASRAALEQALTEWWREDPKRTRPVTLGMIEIDRFSQIEKKFGTKTSNNVLHALATLATGVTRGDDLAALSGGERLMILFPDTGARSATSAVERVRQTIEATQFFKEAEAVAVSVTCAVTEAIESDTTESLLARLEATLVEAQGYGGNRTFLHEGRFPAPVVPPRFCLEPRVVPL